VKILGLDIETAPNTAHVWGLFKQNIGINQLLNTGRVMCFAAKWVGVKGPITFFSEHSNGHKRTIKAAHALIEQADAVLSFNGERFDLPTLNREFLKYELTPPSPYHHIDLLKVAKRRFRFTSNKMDHLARELKLGNKVQHRGHEMWIQCMGGDANAWREMEKYNKQDVVLLEKLYHAMLPWIDAHPNAALYMDDPDAPTCTNCGSTNMQSRGMQRNRAHAYRRYQCQDCGTWQRSRYTATGKNPNVLVQVGG
jgi:DNA polymerase elongation subunit (family B)